VEVICEALDEPRVAIGVLGSRSARAGPTPAGRTALAVVQRVAKPVLVVSPTARVDQTGTVLRVGVALENGEDYVPGPVLRTLLDHDVEVVVVHVFDATHVPAFWEQSQHVYEAWAHEFSLRHFPNGRAEVLLRGGRPGEEILEFVRAEGVELLILQWAQRLAGGHARTVREILSHAEVPVLLMPIPAATRPGVLASAASR
jgi:nucleotide-binding universal stress UspA family protein